MEETKKTLAFIINRQDHREKDSLVTVYSVDLGKKFLVARGTKNLKSKLAGHLEPMSLSEMMIIKGKGRDYVGSVIARDCFLNIRDDLNRLYYAGKALGLFNRLVRDSQADQALFFLLKNYLELLNNFSVGEELDKERGKLFFYSFALKLLAELGYRPDLEYCCVCGEKISPRNNYFSFLEGALVDGKCLEEGGENRRESYTAITDNLIKLMRYILSDSMENSANVRINKKMVKDLSVVVDNFVKFCF